MTILNPFIIFRKKMRWSVIGATSSGKSYLLVDLASALNKMGFVEKNVKGRHSISYFCTNVMQGGAVHPTRLYPCRSQEIYASDYKSAESGTLQVEFIDVPGEVITKESITMFSTIAKAMNASHAKLFRLTTWKVKGGDGDQVKKTVAYKEVTHSGEPGEKMDKSKGYVSSAQIYDENSVQGYEIRKEQEISGRELFDQFLDIDTDTAIEAIIDAWSALGVDNYFSQLVQETLGMNDGYGRQLFERVYKNHFFCLYYTSHATDVVVCDRMAAQGKETTSERDRFSEMMDALASLPHEDKMHPYMAFRGVDVVMHAKRFRRLFEKTDHNTVYSFFLTLLARKTQLEGALAESAEELWERISALDGNEVVQDTDDTQMKRSELAYQYYTDYETLPNAYFRPDVEYTVNSTASQDKKTQLREHIKTRIVDFQKICRPRPAAQGAPVGLPPHVYFTASPIDVNFHIHGLDPKDKTRFEGNVSVPAMRLHFGTYQLLVDILLQHGISLPDEHRSTGRILDYLRRDQ